METVRVMYEYEYPCPNFMNRVRHTWCVVAAYQADDYVIKRFYISFQRLVPQNCRDADEKTPS